MRYTTRIIVPPRIRRSGQPGSGGAYKPQALGVRKTVGFDNPFCLATPAHLAAAGRHTDFAPVFAQSEAVESSRAPSQAVEIMQAATRAVSESRYRQPWGADANLLRQPADVEAAANAGYTYYTVDPSAFLRQGVETMSPDGLSAELQTLVTEGDLPEDWSAPYLNRTVELPGDVRLTLDEAHLQRAAVKYARAVRHCARMSEAIARANSGRSYELEVYLGGTHTPTTTLEHLFVGLELEARGVRLTGFAPAMPGTDDGLEPEGSFVRWLREHAAAAQFCGPYKLSFHGATARENVLPLLGRCCGEGLHVKSDGLSYLEALKVVQRVEPALFEQVLAASQTFVQPATSAQFPQRPEEWNFDPRMEPWLLGGRGAVFARDSAVESSLRTSIMECLQGNTDFYRELVEARFDNVLSLLKAG